MTTAQADEAILGPSEHAAKLAAQYTIGTAYDPFRHFFRTLLPLLTFSDPGVQVDESRRQQTRGGRRERFRSDSNV